MEDETLAQLKTVYNELWRDAKTMIKDMNRNIKMVSLFGLAMFVIAPARASGDIRKRL